MAWTLLAVRFRLLSGAHAGSFPVGNILKTRSYVTGRMFWGAVTAALVRHGLQPRTRDGFERAGEQTRASARFGYLFPFETGIATDRVPAGCLERDDEWEYRFLDTYSSTALNYGEGSAEQGSLHEIEYIRTLTRPTLAAGSKPVNLFGHLAVRTGGGVQPLGNDVDFYG